MNSVSKDIFWSWLKAGALLGGLLLVVRIFPSNAADPWGIFSPRKTALLVFALAVIQFFAEILISLLGARAGTIAAGFLGGLVSSTALVASLARRSKGSEALNSSMLSLIYLSGTFAMLLEAIALIAIGTNEFHPRLLLVFLGPALLTPTLIFFGARKSIVSVAVPKRKFSIQILPLLELSAFIVGVLALSKMLQKYYGQSGLFVLTFLASLFEIHGSVIANVQLHDSGAIAVEGLGDLLAISIAASYFSKLILLCLLGKGASLKIEILKLSGWILSSLLFGWCVFRFL